MRHLQGMFGMSGKMCNQCGTFVISQGEEHTCVLERLISHQIRLLDKALGEWLDTKAGQFETFYAERHRPDGE